MTIYIGNLYVPAISPILEVDKEMKVRLQDLAEVVRKTIKMVDGDFVSKFQRKGKELDEILEPILQVLFNVTENGVPFYVFSSCMRLGFYETNFGWGKPIWVCAIGVGMKNMILLMPSSSDEDEGIEAWVTLNEFHMPQFETDPLLLQFVS